MDFDKVVETKAKTEETGLNDDAFQLLNPNWRFRTGGF